MTLPIIAYGSPVLKKKAKEIPKDYPKLDELIDNMFETMYNASGVGLAAPQIGLSIRLFVVDAKPFSEDASLTEEEIKELESFKRVFINPEIIEENGIEWDFSEGCLSIPDVHEDIFRKPEIKIQYLDENFESQTEVLSGLSARVVQHEYDHIEGVLFTDRISNLKKRLIKSKLSNITKGKIDVGYKMKYPLAKKNR
ncbi:peptide deformylase [Psychroflexus sp. CAK57W]|uniref:peptide deformylase n=1 Tax=Psychroflexus curvus TaxID=2873595 RepID=UPI001CCC2FD3|nr:peptide deformylase [Psychroflexus curvus]MBZ9628417.1 peptide deformylase [Psychroflexus curvus]MBZ9788136.1 peptide deformylase [Psychroflexus curvus]